MGIKPIGCQLPTIASYRTNVSYTPDVGGEAAGRILTDRLPAQDEQRYLRPYTSPEMS
jgi:hypothetical protein